MFNLSHNKKESGQGLVEYALILVLVAIVVIAVLMLLGPIIANVFSTLNSSLSSVSGGGEVAAVGLGCPDIHPDGYATGPGYGWDCYSPTYGAYDMP
jgi:pilus assembly protein Flp/PilA